MLGLHRAPWVAVARVQEKERAGFVFVPSYSYGISVTILLRNETHLNDQWCPGSKISFSTSTTPDRRARGARLFATGIRQSFGAMTHATGITCDADDKFLLVSWFGRPESIGGQAIDRPLAPHGCAGHHHPATLLDLRLERRDSAGTRARIREELT